MKIGVVGSINMDMTVEAERIPLKGETLSGTNLQYIPGGKGANQAVSMAKLGADVTMFGCVGQDSAGKTLVENLESYGICTSYIGKIEAVPTGIALITVGEKDNTIVVVAGANNCVTVEYIQTIKEALFACDIILLQHEIPQETNEYVVDLCYKEGIKVVLNPGPARPVKEEVIEKLTYLTPNEHEVRCIFGNEVSLETLLKKYPEKLIVTQGSKGVISCLQDGTIVEVPARQAKVVDTTGAGDTLNGAFTTQIGAGKSLTDALKFANVAASLSTEKFGAQGGMPTKEEVLAQL